MQARLSKLNSLFSSVENLRGEFFKAPLPKLSFSYAFREKQNLNGRPDIFLLLKEDLKRKKEMEMQLGIPLSGPQKHEIHFFFNGKDSRTFCSKGEQRAFVLALLGSHVQKLPKAFLFLDDVLLELDEKIQNKFLQFLEKNHCQTFLTNCKVISFKTKKMSFFSVKNGIIQKYD